MKRGESFNEAVTPAVIEKLTKQLESSSSLTTEESPRKPALPTPAPTAPHSRKPSEKKPIIDWNEEYRLQAEREQQRLQRLFTQVFQGDVEVSVNDDCDIVQMTIYKGVDAKIPQGKIVSHFIIGDGNCGFRSIAYCLFEDQELHYSVRTAACLAIRGNTASFINKVEGLNSTGTNDTANQSVLEYMADKTQVSENAGQIERWCDENLLEGAALAYSTQIRIYTQYNGENVLLVLDPMNVTAGKSIAIVQNGGHYEVLIDDILDDGAAVEEFEFMAPSRYSRSRAASDSISMISTASVATSLASSTTSSQKARKKIDKTKLKVDGKVNDAVYLWAIATFKGQTALNHQLLLDAVKKGIKFFKYYNKTKTYAADLRLHLCLT